MSEKNTLFEGGCSCGEVRYKVTNTPLIIHCCHCHICQQQNGAAFALNALIEDTHVEQISGSLREHEVPSASGKGQRIFRCSACDSALWSIYNVGSERLLFLRVGTLDEPSAMPPDIHIHTASKLDWVELDPKIPAYEAYYKPKDHWPAESFAWVKALSEN